jgi:endo-1,4-beta-xylanase
LGLVGSPATQCEKHPNKISSGNIEDSRYTSFSPITYTSNLSASGISLIYIYGWTTNPLVEYYIIENTMGYQPTGTQKGTLTSDGSAYAILMRYVNVVQHLGSPPVHSQYVSIRQSARTSGTVTLANHFNAWAAAGMKLGTFNYQVLAAESWYGSGQGSFSVAKGTGEGEF